MLFLAFDSSRYSPKRTVQHLLYPLLLLFSFLILAPAKAIPYYNSQTGVYRAYYNDYQRAPKAYQMPNSNSGKIKVFLLCKPECQNKCQHSIYESRYNTKGECHNCIRACMSATTQQAKFVGINFGGGKNRRMLRDDPFSNRHRRKRKKNQRGAAVSSSLASAQEPEEQTVIKNYLLP